MNTMHKALGVTFASFVSCLVAATPAVSATNPLSVGERHALLLLAQQEDEHAAHHPEAAKAEGGDASEDQGERGQKMGGGMMGNKMMGGGMKSEGMMGHGMGHMHAMHMARMIDTDADGKISKEEFLKFHEWVFNFKDVNGDDKLDASELTGMGGR